MAAQLFLELDNGRVFGSSCSVAKNLVAALQYVDEQHGQEVFVR